MCLREHNVHISRLIFLFGIHSQLLLWFKKDVLAAVNCVQVFYDVTNSLKVKEVDMWPLE